MGRFFRRKKSKNKKIKNATPLMVDGVQYRSKLEAYCASQLKENGIKAEYEKNTYTLIPAFEYGGEKIRPCTYTPDFVSEEESFIIEIKGFANDAFPIKWKMFKMFLKENEEEVALYLPKNQKEVQSTIQSILAKRKLNDKTSTNTSGDKPASK